MIYFALIFAYDVKDVLKFSYCVWLSNISITIFGKDNSVSIEFSASLLKISRNSIVAHNYNPSVLGAQSGRIAWAQTFEASLGDIDAIKNSKRKSVANTFVGLFMGSVLFFRELFVYLMSLPYYLITVAL